LLVRLERALVGVVERLVKDVVGEGRHVDLLCAAVMMRLRGIRVQEGGECGGGEYKRLLQLGVDEGGSPACGSGSGRG